jgi:hypothetical protein
MPLEVKNALDLNRRVRQESAAFKEGKCSLPDLCVMPLRPLRLKNSLELKPQSAPRRRSVQRGKMLSTRPLCNASVSFAVKKCTLTENAECAKKAQSSQRENALS